MTTETDVLADLIEEMADAVRANRSMGIGASSIDNSLRHYYRDRLLTALLSDIAIPEWTEHDAASLESFRKAYKAHLPTTRRDGA
jgi:hypothetical protein